MQKPTFLLLIFLIFFSPFIAFGKDIGGSVWRFYYTWNYGKNEEQELLILFEKNKTLTYKNVVSKMNQGNTYSKDVSTWTINGNVVVISFNSGFQIVTLQLNDSRNKMSGTAKNENGVAKVKAQLDEQVIFANGKFLYPKKPSPTLTNKKSSDQKPDSTSNADKIISAASGTGFAVSSSGHVITNNHVINGCQNLKIHHKGRVIPANVVTYDPNNDLALLKGDFRPSTVFSLSNQKPELLQDVYVAGYPFGQKISTSVKVTKGIISSLTGIGNNFSNIQIDAALQPGNSGGPIINDRGNVVGVAVAKLDLKKILKDFGVIPENTNFGIKTNVVRSFLDSNNVDIPSPKKDKISKSNLGKMISDGTYYLSCWMTMAQIEKMRSKKVIFQNID